MSEQEDIKKSVIDQVEQVVARAKEQLLNVECPDHGQALQKLEFDRTAGRFAIETCCDEGEKMVNEALAHLK